MIALTLSMITAMAMVMTMVMAMVMAMVMTMIMILAMALMTSLVMTMIVAMAKALVAMTVVMSVVVYMSSVYLYRWDVVGVRLCICFFFALLWDLSTLICALATDAFAVGIFDCTLHVALSNDGVWK